jgi:hypothetical protein
MVFLMHSHLDLKKSHFDPRNRVPDVLKQLEKKLLKQSVLGDKIKTIGGTPYKVKRAGTTPTPMDVDIDGVVYSVKMADCVYHVSTNNHSEVTGALIDHSANGGIAGNNC